MKRTLHQTHGRRTRGLLLPFLLLLMLPAGAQAMEERGGTPGDWLSNFAGARSVGLGGAMVAAGDGPLAVVWNPASLTQLYRNELHFETARLFLGTSINSASFAFPARSIPSLGLTVLALRSGEIERTSELNEPLGSFQQTETAFLFSASKDLTPSLMMGGNVKIIRQTVEQYGASGVGLDLGLLYDLNYWFRMGVSLHNLGGPHLTLREAKETYAREVRAGIALQVLSGRGLITTEFDWREGDESRLVGGSEFRLHPSMSLRLGYASEGASGGLSFRLNSDMQLDYGLADHELGITHRVGLSYRFGGFFADAKADPPVFSPLGQPSVTKFVVTARTRNEAASWTLRIINDSDQLVRQFGGRGAPPAQVMWDGKDETGLPVPDGTYRHQIIITDLEGEEMVSEEGSVEVTTSGPKGTVPVSVETVMEGETQ